MADNSGEQKQAPVHKNIHNFSWFPSVLLLFQLFLLLFGLFQFDHKIIDAFNQFLQESSHFLSMINGLLIFWYWIKGAVLKQSNISKEFKITNSCICTVNIILLNKLYDNNKLDEIFSQVKTFFSGENMAICVFVFVIIVAIVLIVRYARKDNKNAPSDKTSSFANSEDNGTATNNAQPLQTSTPTTDNTQSKQTSTSTMQTPLSDERVNVNVLVFIIFMVLFFVIVAVVYLLIAKYDIVTNIINDEDQNTRILNYILLIASAVMMTILSLIIVAAAARSISKFILQIPEYIRRAEVSDDRIIKIAVGIVLIPVFYGITKLFGISTDWLLNLLQNQDFLVVPFIILLYFVLSMLFVEVLYGLFSGKPRAKWLKSFAEIVSSTGDSVVNFCGKMVKSFFRLLNFIPNFLEAIQTVLMGEEDDIDNE